MAELIIKKRGRPSNTELARRKAILVKPVREDADVLADLTLRFDMLDKLTQAALRGNIRALTVTGAPGVGKTYTIEHRLQSTPGAQFEIVQAGISAVGLYKIGYRLRHPGNVIVLDDADSIFKTEEALNVTKALCDTSLQRHVHWLKEGMALKEDDVPQDYEYNGALIFISNLDFQGIIDLGGNAYVPHLEAIMSRSLYLDLQLFTPQAKMLWVRHVALAGKIFQREDISEAMGEAILKWIAVHRQELRELSIRTVTKLCELVKAHPEEWPQWAQVLMCRPR